MDIINPLAPTSAAFHHLFVHHNLQYLAGSFYMFACKLSDVISPGLCIEVQKNYNEFHSESKLMCKQAFE